MQPVPTASADETPGLPRDCTRRAASSSRIPGTSAARGTCRASGSRRSPARVRASPGPRARADNGLPRERRARASARTWRRRPICRSTPISRMASAPTPSAWPRACASRSRPASPASRSRTPSAAAATSAAATSTALRARRAVERVRAARRAIDAAGGEVLLIARAECFLVGLPDSSAPSRGSWPMPTPAPIACMRPASQRRSHPSRGRGRASQARERADECAAPHPRELAELGVRRVSVGGALARAAWGGFMRAARELAEQRQLRGPCGRRLRASALKRCSSDSSSARRRAREPNGAAVMAAKQPAALREQDEHQRDEAAAQRAAGKRHGAAVEFRPMTAPTKAAAPVDMNPCSEAPIPATDPTGPSPWRRNSTPTG